ncbi:MAG: aminotransferase class V-fold PLP-dependent enzyme [Bacteroidales bacterium]|nr:aminotransferase class V-fold PLP-dependent enzyme [Bacteroidales bacterium]
MNVERIRDYFPVTKKYHYFQSAGMSPMPIPVYEKVVHGYRSLLENGDIYWHNDMQQLQKLYEKIAKIVNCKPNDIVFLDSNSMAMSLVGISLKNKHTNFNIVSMEEEFPSNSVPFEYLGIKMKYVNHLNHRYDIDQILNVCDDKTLAVVTSYVQYCTGFRQSLLKLGNRLKQRNILLIVNATQAFPFFPIDMQAMNISVLTCSVHKWGFCGHIGTIFITQEIFRKKYPSPIAGWLSVDVSKSNDFIHTAKGVPFEIWQSAQQYQYGSTNLKSRLALDASLDFLTSYHINTLCQHLFNISSYLIEQLKSIDVEIISPSDHLDERSAIVSFTLKKKANEDLVRYLEQKNIMVSLRNGFIRVSVNIFNNKADVDALINAIQSFIS